MIKSKTNRRALQMRNITLGTAKRKPSLRNVFATCKKEHAPHSSHGWPPARCGGPHESSGSAYLEVICVPSRLGLLNWGMLLRPINMSSMLVRSMAAMVSTKTATYMRASSSAQPSPAKPSSQVQQGVAFFVDVPLPHSMSSVVQRPCPEHTGDLSYVKHCHRICY